MADTMLFSDQHAWVREKGDRLLVGVTEHAMDPIGEPVHVSLPKTGEEVGAGEPFGCIESDDKVFELVSPVSGEVVRVNHALKDDPSLVADDPFRSGWLIEIEPFDTDELDSLMSSDDYRRENG